MLHRLILIFFLALSAAQAAADTDTLRDHYVNELQEDGYEEIRITRTLLGRMRFVALSPRYRREIVINPLTGVVLRDYIRVLQREEEDENEDDGDDDDHDSNEDDDDHDDDDDDDEDDDDEDDDDRDDDDHDDDD
ncbi:MAG: hypothetical protein HKP37_08055 [Boseongicola sp.]|nr:hypothetical protein [Boseongicola sp.]